MNDYEKQLLNMLQYQIVSRGLTEPRILEAMQRVPRHLFAPEAGLDEAYGDHPLSLPEDRATISQPYMVAYMTDALQCRETDRILEIGTGSGYQAAILSHLCAHVYTVERHNNLSQSARITIESLGRTNVSFRTADGLEGWKEEAPFHKIMLTAALRRVPHTLLEQLSEEGILLAPLGDSRLQTLTRITRRFGTYESEELIQCVFVPLISQGRDMTQNDEGDALEASA